MPKVIEYTVEDGKSWLLMSRMMGRMCCDKYYMEHSDEMVSLMAEGLKMLWSIDISDCPREFSLEEDERKALARIKDGRLSAEELAECGFGTAEQMIKWMLENKPAYEPVLSHGDYCLPNVLLENGRISAFIDIGDIGIADKYRDIATCYGSLKNNFGGYFGGRIYEDFDPALLFKKIGGELDPVKIRYSRLIEKVLS